MADSGDGQRDENDMNGGPTSRRPATVGEGRPHAADGPTPDSPLPYKTCTEYVQHLNIWILQTMQYNWFAVNYPLLMSSISSMSAIQSQQQMNGLNNNFSLFNPNLMQNAANSQTNAGQPAGESSHSSYTSLFSSMNRQNCWTFAWLQMALVWLQSCSNYRKLLSQISVAKTIFYWSKAIKLAHSSTTLIIDSFSFQF